MTDVFGRTITIGGVLSGELVRISWGTSPGMIAQQVQISASRPVDQQMDLLTGKIYLISTIPQLTQIVISGLVADVKTYKDFLQAYCSICTNTNELSLSTTYPICNLGATTSNTSVTYKVHQPKLVQYSTSVSVGNYQIVKTIVLVGAGLDIT